MRTKVFSLISGLFIIFMCACSGKTESTPQPSESYVKSLKQQFEEYQKTLPQPAGYGMMLTAIDFDENDYVLIYRYEYTLDGAEKPSQSVINEAETKAIEAIKNSTEEKEMLQNGISFKFDYYNNDGSYLCSVTITPSDIK